MDGGSFARRNPSTTVDKLVIELRKVQLGTYQLYCV